MEEEDFIEEKKYTRKRKGTSQSNRSRKTRKFDDDVPISTSSWVKMQTPNLPSSYNDISNILSSISPNNNRRNTYSNSESSPSSGYYVSPSPTALQQQQQLHAQFAQVVQARSQNYSNSNLSQNQLYPNSNTQQSTYYQNSGYSSQQNPNLQQYTSSHNQMSYYNTNNPPTLSGINSFLNNSISSPTGPNLSLPTSTGIHPIIHNNQILVNNLGENSNLNSTLNNNMLNPNGNINNNNNNNVNPPKTISPSLINPSNYSSPHQSTYYFI